jgi:asparagine synthase (glutamine-hydrolysing)
MCGIAGVLDVREGVSEETLRRMAATMVRRGPDGGGVLARGEIGLAHRRLAIIDLSERAAQPMRKYAGGLSIVFNGEIYNYRELRSQLIALGESFETASDTEVLLAGYHRWKNGLWARLRGMFACAIWDAAARELVLARDPLGKKPLFYTRSGERFAFASTLSSLQEAFANRFRIDAAALNDYLANTVVTGNRTIYRDVHRLPPAHYATVSEGSIRIERYWKLSFDSKLSISADEASEESRRLLDVAVQRRLVSDVPLGAFLSGGFDSGLVVASMARQQPNVRTFTVGTPGSAFDERALAAEVAMHVHSDHQELSLAPTTAAALPRLLADVGQPFGDSSLLPSYEVARAAREAVTVVLTGDGGDEAFFGYTSFQGVLAASTLRRWLPLSPLYGFLSRLLGSEGGPVLRRRIGHVLRLASGGLDATLYNPMGFRAEARRLLLAPGLMRQVQLEEPEEQWRQRWHTAPGADETERYVAAFIEGTLTDTYLTKVDTATMAASLEARCPFLDVDLLEFLAKVPRRIKFPRGTRKRLLRPLVRQQLPDSILRQPKRGFSLPVGDWMRSELRGVFESTVLDPRGPAAELINVDVARTWFERHLAGENHQSRLWTLLSLGVWLRLADHSADPDVPLDAWAA